MSRKRSRQIRFTALLHHVDVEALEREFRRLRRAVRSTKVLRPKVCAVARRFGRDSHAKPAKAANAINCTPLSFSSAQKMRSDKEKNSVEALKMVVPRMATKATSRPEGGPRLMRSQDEKRLTSGSNLSATGEAHDLQWMKAPPR
jgi:hypothetical protein